MQSNLEKYGQYELFQTTKGHQILSLNDKNFYAVVEGQKGDILVKSDSDHEKKKTIKKGKFYLAKFDDDPEFNDLPHLFLENGKSIYREWILPQDLPSNQDYQKKLIRTDKPIAQDKVEYHTEATGKKGREKQFQGTSKHASSRLEAADKKASAKSDRKTLKSKSKDELYDRAKKNDISDQSEIDNAKMNKKEIVKNLSRLH